MGHRHSVCGQNIYCVLLNLAVHIVTIGLQRVNSCRLALVEYNNNNNNNRLLLLLTAIWLSPGGSGYFTCTQI